MSTEIKSITIDATTLHHSTAEYLQEVTDHPPKALRVVRLDGGPVLWVVTDAMMRMIQCLTPGA